LVFYGAFSAGEATRSLPYQGFSTRYWHTTPARHAAATLLPRRHL